MRIWGHDVPEGREISASRQLSRVIERSELTLHSEGLFGYAPSLGRYGVRVCPSYWCQSPLSPARRLAPPCTPPGDGLTMVKRRRQHSDDELVARTRNGDTDACSDLWHRYHRTAFSAARNLGKELDADDLVAETFAALYTAITSGERHRPTFRRYLFATIRGIATRGLPADRYPLTGKRQ